MGLNGSRRARAARIALIEAEGARTEIDLEPLPSVRANQTRLEQVLVNLLSNAIRHGGPNIGIVITARSGIMTCTVTDDGPGLNPAVADRLIRDKISAADWDRHLGKSESLFVNASTWALMLTGRIVRMHDYVGQTTGGTVRRLVARLVPAEADLAVLLCHIGLVKHLRALRGHLFQHHGQVGQLDDVADRWHFTVRQVGFRSGRPAFDGIDPPTHQRVEFFVHGKPFTGNPDRRLQAFCKR